MATEERDVFDSSMDLAEIVGMSVEDMYEPNEDNAGGTANGKISKKVKFKESKTQKTDGDSKSPRFLRSIWATRHTENVQNRRIFIKTSLRELIIYLTFVVILLLITLLMVNSMTYFYYVSVFDLFAAPYTDPVTNTTTSFNDITDLNSVWKYLQGQLLNGLYWDTWYNQLNVSFNEKELIGFDNKLLGVPRLRQLRVDPSHCQVPKKMTLMTKVCYPDYSTAVRGTNPIEPKGGLVPVYTTGAWKFQTATETGAVSYSAPINTYDGSGYVQDLSRDRNVTEAILNELITGLWIDQATRVLFVDFTIYNANINMFVIVKLVFEFPYTGGVFAGNDFQPAKLVRYVTWTDYFVLAFEMAFLLFVAYYIVEECIEIYKNKWMYFCEFWNVLDIVVMTNCVFCIALVIFCTVTTNRLIDSLITEIDLHPKFDVLSFWYGHNVRGTATCVFLAILKIFKYVNFDQSLGQLTKTLSLAAYDLIGFLIMFCIIYFAFAQLSYLAFGASTIGFQSFTQSCYSLFRMMVGDIDFPALRKAHFLLGPLFFVLFIFFAVFVLLNMFLAIINDAYATVKEDLVNQKTQLKLGSMVKHRAKEMLDTMRKKSKKSLVQILRECKMFDREIIPFDEYRRVLKRYGYGEAEITSTFVKYDHDGDNCLNLKEQRCMEDELEIGVKKSAKKLEEDEGHGTDDESGPVQQDEENEVEYVHPMDYQELVERVDALEASLVTMLSHSDELLALLEQVERAKREHRQRLLEMFNSEEFKSPSNDTEQ